MNNRQKAQLKSLANPLKAVGQIGKEGISVNLISFLDDALECHELIKLHVLKSAAASINEVAVELSRLLHCEVVQIIGKVIILYRQSSENKRIKLVK